MCANSLAAGQELMKTCGNSATLINSCNKGVLIGGFTNNEIHMDEEMIEHIKAASCPDTEATHISKIAFSYRSLLKPQQGASGTGLLYRKGETVIVDTDGTNSVLVIVQFLSVAINGQFRQYVNGKLIPRKMDGDGQVLEFAGTSLPLLHSNNGTGQSVIVPTTCILRKIILCPNPSNSVELVAIDFQRKHMPMSKEDIFVPFYPLEGDMVLINGTDPCGPEGGQNF